MDVKFPIGKLEVPEHVTAEHVQEWLGKIGSYTARLREVVDGLGEEQLGKKYREGSWTVRQLVHHIADSQLTMYQRLRLALTDDNPTVPAFDQEKWAELPDNELPVESSIRILEGLNERIIAIGKHVTDEQLKRVLLMKRTAKSALQQNLQNCAGTKSIIWSISRLLWRTEL